MMGYKDDDTTPRTSMPPAPEPPRTNDIDDPLEMTLAETLFCTFDVETTGLSYSSRMIEIGAVRFTIGGEQESFCTLVNPRVAISAGSTAIHGITREMLSGAPHSAEALRDFIGFIDGAVLIAHNAGFDVGIVSTELIRAGLSFPSNPVLDSVLMARRYLQGLRSYKLVNLAKNFGLDTSTMHRALADASITRRIFENCITLNKREGDSLQELLHSMKARTFSDFWEAEADVPDGFEVIRDAIESRSSIRAIYAGGSHGDEPRMLTPHRVFQRWGSCYLEALCHIDNINKTFLLDRFEEIELAP
ncbi:MAG: exonuclease domain-containing protein [Candidatus Geothermincolia bacterium]